MRFAAQALLVLIITRPRLAMAGDLEIGGAGGFGFYQDASITNASGSAQAGFGPRIVLSAVAGWNWSRHFGLEGRYTFQDGDAALRAQDREANLDADAQSAMAELVFSGQPKTSRFRFFGAVGCGVKLYQATQPSAGGQPLTDFATLQKASQAEPLITYGAGVKYRLWERWLVRVEFREYTTPFPARVITPAPGARLHGWMDDIVPTLGISRTF
jgi:opacity protein-like surface antigen